MNYKITGLDLKLEQVFDQIQAIHFPNCAELGS